MQVGTVVVSFGLLIWLAGTGIILTLLILAIRTLRKYLRSEPVRREKTEMKRSLGGKLTGPAAR